jgi:hypothetical protein
MNNNEKAIDIAKKYHRIYDDYYDSMQECIESAREMAEWKETQMLAILKEEMKKQLKNYISYAILDNEIQINNIVNDAIRTIKNKLNINE